MNVIVARLATDGPNGRCPNGDFGRASCKVFEPRVARDVISIVSLKLDKLVSARSLAIAERRVFRIKLSFPLLRL